MFNYNNIQGKGRSCLQFRAHVPAFVFNSFRIYRFILRVISVRARVISLYLSFTLLFSFLSGRQTRTFSFTHSLTFSLSLSLSLSVASRSPRANNYYSRREISTRVAENRQPEIEEPRIAHHEFGNLISTTIFNS